MDLSNLNDFLSVVGAAALILAPFVKAWVKQTVQKAMEGAPALLALGTRLDQAEKTIARHDDAVREVPGISRLLERLEHTLDNLDGTLRQVGERVAALEGAG